MQIATYGPAGLPHPRERRPDTAKGGAHRGRLLDHPTGPWLAGVRGADPEILARLLARLDPRRASTPSAFWAYCGFATVPGVEWHCMRCGANVTAAAADQPPAHPQRSGQRTCSGTMRPSRGPESGLRVAQSKSASGNRPGYDAEAKGLCYELGNGLLAAGGAYAAVYHNGMTQLERTRAHWPRSRRHVAALRKMEKLFLAHLWLVWREALDLPLTLPYSPTGDSASEAVGPWAMVELDRSAARPSSPPRAASPR